MEKANSGKDGVGWMLSLVELLMSEYRCTHHEAMWEFPLAKLIVLLPARAQRLGLPSSGGDHVTKAMEKARKKVRRLLREKFTIRPNPGTPPKANAKPKL